MDQLIGAPISNPDESSKTTIIPDHHLQENGNLLDQLLDQLFVTTVDKKATSLQDAQILANDLSKDLHPSLLYG